MVRWKSVKRKFPTGFGIVTKEAILERRKKSGWIERLRFQHIQAPRGKAYYSDRRGIMDIIDESARPIFPKPLVKEYVSVKQSFGQPRGLQKHATALYTERDIGFQSSKSFDITPTKAQELLSKSGKMGYRQI